MPCAPLPHIHSLQPSVPDSYLCHVTGCCARCPGKVVGPWNVDSHGVVLATVLPVDPVFLNNSNKKVPTSRYCVEAGHIPYPQSLCGIQKPAELLGLCFSKQAKMGRFHCPPPTISLDKNLSGKVITLIQAQAYKENVCRKCLSKLKRRRTCKS